MRFYYYYISNFLSFLTPFYLFFLFSSVRSFTFLFPFLPPFFPFSSIPFYTSFAFLSFPILRSFIFLSRVFFSFGLFFLFFFSLLFLSFLPFFFSFSSCRSTILYSTFLCLPLPFFSFPPPSFFLSFPFLAFLQLTILQVFIIHSFAFLFLSFLFLPILQFSLFFLWSFPFDISSFSLPALYSTLSFFFSPSLFYNASFFLSFPRFFPFSSFSFLFLSFLCPLPHVLYSFFFFLSLSLFLLILPFFLVSSFPFKRPRLFCSSFLSLLSDSLNGSLNLGPVSERLLKNLAVLLSAFTAFQK